MTQRTSVVDHERPQEPPSIGKVRLLGSFGGQIMIEWTLTTPVDPAWIGAFSRSPVRGPGCGPDPRTAAGSGAPVVLPEGAIRWSVPHADLRHAAAVVLQSVAFANRVTGDRRAVRTPRSPAVGTGRGRTTTLGG